MEVTKILNQCTINGNIVTLPNIQLDRKLYQDVAKKIELIGGKWCRKNKGFIFKQNPTELFEAIKTGEKKDIKKEYQFFATPQELAEKMAGMLPDDVKFILEPSAGQGAIVQAVNKLRPRAKIFYCELMELNRMQFKGDAEFLQDDFLTLSCPMFDRGEKAPPESVKFDAVIANPPFAKNQDIEHFYKMAKHAKKIVISVMSNHWRTSKNKKESDFRAFLEDLGAEIIEIPSGTFKESGTNVSACLVVIKK